MNIIDFEKLLLAKFYIYSSHPGRNIAISESGEIKPGHKCVMQHHPVGEDWNQEESCQGLLF